MLQHAGGATRRKARPPTSFTPHRWEFSVVIIALWTDPSQEARASNERWADNAFEELRAHGAGLYAVDIDRFHRGDNTAVAETREAFGDGALERLQALKRRVDPTDVFRAAVPLHVHEDDQQLVRKDGGGGGRRLFGLPASAAVATIAASTFLALRAVSGVRTK